MDKTTKQRAQDFIKEVRRRKEWSQKEMARKIGLYPSQLNQYETGVNKVPADVLFKIADAVGMDIGLVEKSKDTKKPDQDEKIHLHQSEGEGQDQV